MQPFPEWYFSPELPTTPAPSFPRLPFLQADPLPSVGSFKDVGARSLSPMIWQTPTLSFSPGGLGLEENWLSEWVGWGKEGKGLCTNINKN